MFVFIVGVDFLRCVRLFHCGGSFVGCGGSFAWWVFVFVVFVGFCVWLRLWMCGCFLGWDPGIQECQNGDPEPLNLVVGILSTLIVHNFLHKDRQDLGPKPLKSCEKWLFFGFGPGF